MNLLQKSLRIPKLIWYTRAVDLYSTTPPLVFEVVIQAALFCCIRFFSFLIFFSFSLPSFGRCQVQEDIRFGVRVHLSIYWEGIEYPIMTGRKSSLNSISRPNHLVSISTWLHLTYSIDTTMILLAIILKIVSLHDLSLRAA